MQDGWNTLDHLLSIEALYTAFEKKCDKDFYFAGEMHDFWEFVYVKQGEVGAAADDVVYKLSKTQIIFHKPMEFHRLWAESGTEPEVFIMSFKMSGQGASDLENRVFQLNYETETLLHSLISHINKAFEPSEKGGLERKEGIEWVDFQLVANDLERLFLIILKKNSVLDTKNHTQSARNYSLIVQQIEEHLFEPLSLNKVAELCNMSISTVKKTFAKYGGQGLMKYINQRKISEAVSLLQNGKNVTEVSDILAFSTQSYFSTVFKQFTGTKPSEYMRR